MRVVDIFYFLFGVFALYAAYNIATGQWDFSQYLLPTGKSIAVFLGI